MRFRSALGETRLISKPTLVLGMALVAVVGWSVAGDGVQSGQTASIEAPNHRSQQSKGALTLRCEVASITDGDTLRCADGTRVRLSGIAARERDGSCSSGHPCPTASAEASTAALDRLASGQVLECQANGETYGRVAAFCRNAAGVDLSCAMVESGAAELWPRYWRDHEC